MKLSAFGNFLKRTFTGTKTHRVFQGFIDGEQIAKLKADAQSRGAVPFVSTNDIITSAFSGAGGLGTCLMAYNCRERMSELAENRAGNYVKCMAFDNINTATPDCIRLALTNPR